MQVYRLISLRSFFGIVKRAGCVLRCDMDTLFACSMLDALGRLYALNIMIFVCLSFSGISRIGLWVFFALGGSVCTSYWVECTVAT